MKQLNHFKYWAGAAVFAAAGLMSACGGSGTDGNTSSADAGEIMIGLTDAEGDFVAYAVDVDYLRLHHQDGRVVDVLPETTRIDFTQYVELTELLSVATVPNGRYVAAEISFDYSNADVLVEVAGVAVAAQLEDGNGYAVTSLHTSVSFDDGHPLVIAPGVSNFLTLDFDLETGNRVDTSTTPPTVVVEPMLVADVGMAVDKPMRLRGLLQSVDVSAQTIQMAVRPGHARVSRFGDVAVSVGTSTAYEINGVSFSGDAGLQALSEQAENSWLLLQGRLQDVQGERIFLASEVHAGSSVPGGDVDGLVGVVTARDATTLTVQARALWLTEGGMKLNQTINVTPDGDTLYRKQGSDEALTLAAVSVGQRVSLMGDVSASMSMTPSHVRLLMSGAAGEAVSLNPGELVMQLTALNARAVAAYDFSGTGTGAANDANPHAYQVDTSVLSLGGINIGDPLRVRGFVAPYGSAPLDFIASSVIDLSQVNAHMSLRWVPAESAVLSVIDNDQLVFDLSGSERARVRRHEYVLDLPSSVPVTIAAPSDDAGLYAMQKRGAGTQVFRSFARFSEALTSEITASNKVSQVMAKGSYHDANSVLQADHVHIKLK